uniref:Uncharacterized protein n=1 Tax=Tanacetum cinerariifolium TaxID=118510 RepID=A0A6L2M110_TANCI|nr:hypothetical protein [Tanacetum cinerariifolium]
MQYNPIQLPFPLYKLLSTSSIESPDNFRSINHHHLHHINIHTPPAKYLIPHKPRTFRNTIIYTDDQVARKRERKKICKVSYTGQLWIRKPPATASSHWETKPSESNSDIQPFIESKKKKRIHQDTDATVEGLTPLGFPRNSVTEKDDC